MCRSSLGRVALLLSIALWAGATLAADAPTRFLLVRHAEKQQGGKDPELTGAGRSRAGELARVLADVSLDAVYASQFLRTRLTAEPTAQDQGVDVTVEPIEGDVDVWASEFARRLLERHPGGAVLVVGHSNTIPALMRALGDERAPNLGEGAYDDLFVLTRVGAQASTLRLRYGAASTVSSSGH